MLTVEFIFANMFIMYFHRQLDWASVQTATFSFGSLNGFLMLYVTLVRRKLKYASVLWNSITYTDVSKLESIQWKFLSLCHHNFFFNYVQCNYENVSNQLKFLGVCVRRRHLDAHIPVHACSGKQVCPSLMENTGLRVPA